MVGLLFWLSIVILSQAGTLIRYADASSLAICFWRLLIAGGVLLPFALRPAHVAALRAFRRRDWQPLLLSGIFLFAHFYFFFRSVQETTIANSILLFSLNPVTTAIGAYWIFGERVTLHLVLACALGFAGVLALFGASLLTSVPDNAAGGLLGDVWALLSALFFSGYILTGKHLRRKLSNTVFACAIYLQTALYAGAAMLILGTPFLGYSSQTWSMFALLAFLPTLMGHAIFTYCLNSMNVNFMSCMTLVEPVLASLVAVWLFHEPLTRGATLGFFLTVASVMALYWEWLFAYLLRAQRRRNSNGV